MTSFTTLKVKSHSDTVPAELKHGNDMADMYAGEAVREITSGDEARVLRLDRKTRLIQERMIQALFMFPKRGRHPQEAAPEASQIRAPRIAATKKLEHEVTRRGPYLECARCGQFWLSNRIDRLQDLGPCFGHTICGNPERDRPWVIPTSAKQVRWGQQVLHRSHQARWIRGVMFCTECGAYSTGGNTFRKLAAQCRPNSKGVCAQQTRKLYEGKRRPGLKKWPMHPNHLGNKRINEYHYYPDTDPRTVQQAGGDPRGLTTTGRQAADKFRDLRLRWHLTGTTTKPKRPEAVPNQPPRWVAPEWILKALTES